MVSVRRDSVRPRLVVALVALVVAAVLSTMHVKSAQAGTIVVNSTLDDKRGSDGLCTLREAIIAANTDMTSGNKAGECPAGQGADLIVLKDPGVYTLTRSDSGNEDSSNTGDLDIRSDITIQPSWWPTPSLQSAYFVVDGNGLPDRVFHVISGNSTIQGITIRRGNIKGDGGGLYVMPGASLTLRSSTVTQNTATNAGGGVYNAGTLTLVNATLGDNVASSSPNQPAGTPHAGGSNLVLDSGYSGFNVVAADGYNAVYVPQHGSKPIAIDQGNNAVCAAVDQRGVPRPQPQGGTGICDLGAYEVIVVLPVATGDTYAVGEDQTLTVPAPGVLANDIPGNAGATLTALKISDPAPAEAFTFDPNGSFSYRPPRNFYGTVSFQYRVVEGAYQSPPVTVTIQVLSDGMVEVINLNDSGEGSLRWAIEQANTTPDDTIAFELDSGTYGPGPYTIALSSPLLVTAPLHINGTPPGIILDGVNQSFDGMVLQTGSDGSTIQGLTFQNFFNAISIIGSVNNLIAGNTFTNYGGAAVDLGGDGPTLNDPGDVDSGANNFQNYPQIVRATQGTNAGGNPALVLTGLLNSQPGTYNLHFYLSSSCDSGALAPLNGGAPYSATISGLEGSLDATFRVTPTVESGADYTGWVVRATATDASNNTSELSTCTRIGLDNDIWPNALPITPSGSVQASEFSPIGQVSQYLDQLGQSRWYKLQVTPNSRYKIDLTNLPANYDLTVYTDLVAAFNELADLNPNQLGAEITSDPTNPSQSVVEGAYSSAATAGSALNGSALNGSALNGSALNGSALNGSALNGSALNGSALNGSALNGSALNGSALNGSALNGSALNTLGLSAEDIAWVYSAAQARSLIAVSAFEGTADESVVVNSWNNTGYFYVRVTGSGGVFDPTSPFTLSVQGLLDPGCSAVLQSSLHDIFEDTSYTGLPEEPGTGRETVILFDEKRMLQKYGSTAVGELKLALGALAADVNGVVVYVNDAKYPRVAAANQLAGPAAPPSIADWPYRFGLDALPSDLESPDSAALADGITCPYAKNLVAQSIKEIVDSYAANNPLKYVVIVGNDDVIPFFRYPDSALLGPESDYVVPVESESTSEYALRLNYVLSQDAYGADVHINLKDNRFPIPKLAVGRLVEHPDEIIHVINAYFAPGGKVLEPQRALVTGYDFLEDGSRAVTRVLTETIGATDVSRVDFDLIDPQELATLLSPNPEFNTGTITQTAWSAQDLIDKLNNNDYDLMFLAGHFEAAAALAGDYRTMMLTNDLLASPIDFTNALIYSAGCHSGYSVVGEHNLPYTQEPDWAQAFAMKGATFIGGTGYQYGDTDYLEYSERLYLYFTRELRSPDAGNARTVGEALVAAKQRYLATTPIIRSLHEKTLLVSTLFGLPMRKVYLPGQRSDTTPIKNSLVPPNPEPAPTGLRVYDLPVMPGLNLTNDRRTAYLTSTDDLASTELATWLEHEPFGVASNPGEPVVPLLAYDVTDPGSPTWALRSVSLKGGCYADSTTVNDSTLQTGQQPFIPLTGAPTTEISSAHLRFVSGVFAPSQPWSENYFDALAGGATYLNVTPVQYISNPDPAALSQATGYPYAIERVYSQMDFRLYYSGAPTVTAAPPAIVSVESGYDEGTQVAHFAVRAVGEPDAGVHEVWVTFTPSNGATAATGGGLLGPDCSGPGWRTLRLTQNPADPGLWEGTLNLGTTIAAEEFRFFVQATGADGGGSWNTNLGRYFSLVNQDRTPTTLTLQGPAVATGAVGTTATFVATLTETDSGAFVAGQTVTLGLAEQIRTAQTDGNGTAVITIPILGVPDTYDATAWFAGATDLEPSTSDPVSFEITRQTTQLMLAVDTVEFASPDFPYVATLADGVGNRLVEKTIFFIFSNATETYTRTAKTGLFGEARLSRVDVPLGEYTVRALFLGTRSYFGSESGSVPLSSCSSAVAVDAAGEATLWPLNKNLVPFKIVKRLGADGVPVPFSFNGIPATIAVTAIYQDEPVAKPPDASLMSAAPGFDFEVKADRNGSGDGRVYHMLFVAEAGGTSCTGEVLVATVPHDQSSTTGAVDQGRCYDSISGAATGLCAPSNTAVQGPEVLSPPRFLFLPSITNR